MKKSVFFGLLIFLTINSVVFGQSAERDRPKLKNFGWSLQPKTEEITENDGGKSDKPDDVIRVETNLVVNDIFVSDKQGRAISGLTKEDFIVTEDNQPQKIDTFTLGGDAKIPRSIVLIMDYSGSLLPYIKNSVEAAKVLIDQLNPEDRMAIVTDDIELLTDFTRDKTLLKEKLESLKTKALSGKPGRSEQYSALYAVLNEIFDEEDVRPIIFFQTDGDEYYALKGGRPLAPDSPIKQRNFSFEDILAAAEKSRATIYTIMPGMKYVGLSASEQIAKAKKEYALRMQAYAVIGKALPLINENPEFRERMLRIVVNSSLNRLPYLNNLSKSTGGWTSILENPEQAGNIYAQILSLINRRYVLGYYPTNETRDGKRRDVKIEVRNHPEYTVWAHKSYFARPSQQQNSK